MLTLVEVRTDQGVLLSLPMQDASAGFVLENIEGLDPVKATLVSSNFAMLDGAQYQNSRREPRNITLTLGFEPDYSVGSVQELRARLYEFFMPKSQVELRLYRTVGPILEIKGRVESFEMALFTKEPTAVISLMCFDPAFYESEYIWLDGGTVADATSTVINYPGNIENGINFLLYVNRTISNFTLTNSVPSGASRSLYFVSPVPLVAGDSVHIQTVAGSKEVRVNHLGVQTSGLHAISPQSSWLSLYPGENNFRAQVAGVTIPYTMYYQRKYGGL